MIFRLGGIWYNWGIMALFGKQKPPVWVVIDTGSHFIKALILEKADGSGLPKVVRKMNIKLSPYEGAAKTVAKLRQLVFEVIKNLERVPQKIVISLGPNVAEYSLQSWGIQSLGTEKKNSSQELKNYFHNLFEQNCDKTRALLAFPLEIVAGGYSIDAETLKKSVVKDLSFNTFLLYFPLDVGTALNEMKQSLGGLPIEFVPQAVAYKEAISAALKISDAFLIDVGGEYTALSLLGEGKLRQFQVFPLGLHHFLKDFAVKSRISLQEAEEILRQHFQGISAPQKSQLDDIISQKSAEWQQKFQDSLGYFYHKGPLPAQIFFFGEGACLKEIELYLRNPAWMNNFSYVTSPQLRVWDASGIFGGETLGGFLQGPEEVGLASLIFYAFHYKPLF